MREIVIFIMLMVGTILSNVIAITLNSVTVKECKHWFNCWRIAEKNTRKRIAALEKERMQQVAMKPSHRERIDAEGNVVGQSYWCPSCDVSIVVWGQNFCCHCGQRLSWEVEWNEE